MAVAVDIDPVDDVMPRRSLVTGANQIDVPAGRDRSFEDVMQMEFGPSSERIADIAPVDRQDPQDTASGLRAITPMVGVV